MNIYPPPIIDLPAPLDEMLHLPFTKHNIDRCAQRAQFLSHQTIVHASKRLDLCFDGLEQILTLPFDGAIASFRHDTL